ncbi:MAG: hypothetical protein COU71_01460 [Parcubacteria group bacterium CG10_big_fil_rev_8_21_14_0_10_38_31]|nr:MAG: hypothetical protein COU71_01460 [Parcubacteria group bacterium CG10_big_fil_rev_8_21_14_0_10_38_31]
MGNKDKIIIKIIIGFILFTIVAGYSYYEVRDFLAGPKIEIISPKNGVIINKSLIEIHGTAKNISKLFLNDKQIFTDEEGIFSEELLLSLGYNIIEFKAEDRFEREVKQTLEIIYK